MCAEVVYGVCVCVCVCVCVECVEVVYGVWCVCVECVEVVCVECVEVVCGGVCDNASKTTEQLPWQYPSPVLQKQEPLQNCCSSNE